MAAKYQVALVSSEYPPNICGGLGVHVGQMTAALVDQVQYELFVPRFDNYSPTHPSIKLHEVDVPRASNELELWLRFCYATALSINSSPISAQLIHCHDWMTILAGIKLRQMVGVPLVFNVHLPEHIGSRMCLENIGLVAADLVIVNSWGVRGELLARELPIGRIEVVPNGVDSSVFRPDSDWPRDDGYILFVGRLVAQKGLDFLLQAFAVVLHRCPESRLVIVGDGDLELYFKRIAHYLGISHRVHFVNWQIGPDLVKLFQRSQVVVMPSYYEPFGIVALEAMSCGRPVIASRVGGLIEIIEDGVQGYLVPPGDYLELARRLTGLILDPRKRHEMGDSARARALSFSWDSAAAKTVNLYASLISKPIIPHPVQAIVDVSRDLFTEHMGELEPIGLELLGLK